jgi:hypothetical protein
MTVYAAATSVNDMETSVMKRTGVRLTVLGLMATIAGVAIFMGVYGP